MSPTSYRAAPPRNLIVTRHSGQGQTCKRHCECSSIQVAGSLFSSRFPVLELLNAVFPEEYGSREYRLPESPSIRKMSGDIVALFPVCPFLLRLLRGGCSAGICAVLLVVSATAQDPAPPTIQGYITAIPSADMIVLADQQIRLQPNTRFEWMEDNSAHGARNIRSELQVGTFVQVYGSPHKRTELWTPDFIKVRDDWNQKISGLSAIDKVVATGSEPLLRADGYLIRVTPATSISFNEEVKSRADIRPDTWLRYEGNRQRTGVLVASKIAFVHAKSSSDTTAGPSSPSPSGPAEDEDGVIRYTPINDAALQQRIQRIGMAVVPGYQKELHDDSPSKIHFRFVATDNEKYHWENCTSDGLILVPKLVIDRLTRDDQLAAVLADGVAFNLQRQAARVYGEGHLLDGIQNSSYLFLPVGLAAVVGSRTVEREMLYTMEEQRGRVALALMCDAGYDPWQSPEAWRLLAPKHLPTDLTSLHYPENSGNLLNILSLQYLKATTPSSAAATLQ
jgi:hypothetical protein